MMQVLLSAIRWNAVRHAPAIQRQDRCGTLSLTELVLVALELSADPHAAAPVDVNVAVLVVVMAAEIALLAARAERKAIVGTRRVR